MPLCSVPGPCRTAVRRCSSTSPNGPRATVTWCVGHYSCQATFIPFLPMTPRTAFTSVFQVQKQTQRFGPLLQVTEPAYSSNFLTLADAPHYGILDTRAQQGTEDREMGGQLSDLGIAPSPSGFSEKSGERKENRGKREAGCL